MSKLRMQRIDFQRPSRFRAGCPCEWRAEPVPNASLAESLFPSEAPILDVDVDVDVDVDLDVALAEAAREVYASLIPALKEAARRAPAHRRRALRPVGGACRAPR